MSRAVSRTYRSSTGLRAHDAARPRLSRRPSLRSRRRKPHLLRPRRSRFQRHRLSADRGVTELRKTKACVDRVVGTTGRPWAGDVTPRGGTRTAATLPAHSAAYYHFSYHLEEHARALLDKPEQGGRVNRVAFSRTWGISSTLPRWTSRVRIPSPALEAKKAISAQGLVDRLLRHFPPLPELR